MNRLCYPAVKAALIGIFVVSAHCVNAQISMILERPTPVSATLHHLLSPFIVSPASDMSSCYLQGQVKDKEGRLVAEFRTSLFDLTKGSQKINYEDIGLASQVYTDSRFEEVITSTGLFPFEEYSLCTQLLKFEFPKLAEACTDFIPMRLLPPRLTFPRDKDALNNKYPVLTWLPVVVPPSFDLEIKYQLRLVELDSLQSPQEGIVSNPAMLEVRDINQTLYPYTSIEQPLEYEKTYAWQVVGYTEAQVIGASEVWVFTLKEDSIDEWEPVQTQYVGLSPHDKSAFTVAYGVLKFKYVAEYNNGNLNYSIYDNKGNNITPEDLALEQKLGLNLYEVDLSRTPVFKHKGVYLLEVIDEKSKKHYIRFEYLNPYKR